MLQKSTYVKTIFLIAGPKTISSAGLFFNNIRLLAFWFASFVIPKGSDITSNYKRKF